MQGHISYEMQWVEKKKEKKQMNVIWKNLALNQLCFLSALGVNALRIGVRASVRIQFGSVVRSVRTKIYNWRNAPCGLGCVKQAAISWLALP